jgi:hypothetical protein
MCLNTSLPEGINMDTNDYFLKISEYCDFSIDCINGVLSDRKKLRKILGIENRKDLDNVWSDISTNFADYVYRNYKKFPKEELARFIVDNMCGYDFKCMLETLKQYDMLDMLDYLLDYFKKNYDIEKIVNDIMDSLYITGIPSYLDYLGENEFILPYIAWLEISTHDRPELVLLMDMDIDELPGVLYGYFEDMENEYLYDYEEVFGDGTEDYEVPEDIANRIEEVVDGIYSRVVDRLKELAKGIYEEALHIVNNNPAEYKIVDYVKCESYVCHLLGIDKIPLVHIEENRKEYLLNT